VASRPYFIGSIIGYLIAIVTTVVIMFMFDHGQPALLYLVPGVLLSVVFNAWRLGEIEKVYEHSEETLTAKEPAEAEGAAADSSKAAQVASEKKDSSK
jgi:minor histocompatibility antigen H13